MKMQDFRCPECAYEAEGLVRAGEEHRVCPTCCVFMTPIYKATARVIADDIPGGLVVENLGPTPITVYSKSELRAVAASRGLMHYVQHRPEQGSDKSKFTSRWI